MMFGFPEGWKFLDVSMAIDGLWYARAETVIGNPIVHVVRKGLTAQDAIERLQKHCEGCRVGGRGWGLFFERHEDSARCNRWPIVKNGPCR